MTGSPSSRPALPLDLDLSGRTALVTGCGSSSGIGFATARALAQRGARVAMTATTERIEALLEAGARPEAGHTFGPLGALWSDTPLSKAAEMGDTAAVEALPQYNHEWLPLTPETIMYQERWKLINKAASTYWCLLLLRATIDAVTTDRSTRWKFALSVRNSLAC